MRPCPAPGSSPPGHFACLSAEVDVSPAFSPRAVRRRLRPTRQAGGGFLVWPKRGPLQRPLPETVALSRTPLTRHCCSGRLPRTRSSPPRSPSSCYSSPATARLTVSAPESTRTHSIPLTGPGAAPCLRRARPRLAVVPPPEVVRQLVHHERAPDDAVRP